MKDLQAQLETVLDAAVHRTAHDAGCHLANQLPISDQQGCYCAGRWGLVRAEIARTIERMVKQAVLQAIAKSVVLGNYVPNGWDTPIIDKAWAAALEAGK